MLLICTDPLKVFFSLTFAEISTFNDQMIHQQQH